MYLNMEDLKIYSLNFFAIAISALESLNPYLQSIVLLLTIVYTTIGIINRLKNNKHNGKD